MNTKVTYDKQELDSIIADTKMAQYSDVFERHVWARAAKVAVEEVERLRAENAALREVLKELASEACDSVEYSDWPELQELVEKAHKLTRQD